ncbi:efflux transporter outer membrane subunit [Thiolapillus sp.]
MPESPSVFLRLLLLPAILVLLGGCATLGPDFEEPRSNWLDDWKPALHGIAASADQATEQPELSFWWRMFNDPVLNDLIRQAHDNNPQLRIAALRIFESRALAGIAGSSLYPQVQQFSGSATYVNSNNAPMVADGGFGSYQAGFGVGWELDFWGRFRRSIESADAAFFASIENQQALQILINAQIVDLYFTYRTTQARITIANKNARIQEQSLKITREQFQSGNTSELDVQQARTQYLSTLATIPELERGLVQLRNALAVLLGKPPGELPELENDQYELPHVDRTTVAVLPSELLLRRPDIRAAAWLVAAQSAQIGIAEADFYPAISLLGSLGWAGSSLGGGTSTTFAAGPALKWNIFDYGRIENNVRLQDARLQQLIEQYQAAVLAAAQEVDNAAISVVKLEEQLKLLQQTVESAERALEIANTSYHEGYADFQRVLDAQRALFTQNDRLVSIQGNNISAIVALYKSLGGGWMPVQTEPLLPASVTDIMKQRVDWGNLLDTPLPAPPLLSAPETKPQEMP